MSTHTYSVEAHRQANRAWHKAHPESRIKDKESLRSRYRSMKWKAKIKNLELTLSFEEYSQIVASGLCIYDQQPLPKQGSGIDRLDNQIGYVPGNCVPCCASCNSKKGRLEGLGFRYPRTVDLLKEVLNS